MTGTGSDVAQPAAVVDSALYAGLAGKRLALVESMLHSVFYDGIHLARALGLDVRLLIRDREWYGDEDQWADHPLARVDSLCQVDTHSLDAVLAAVTDRRGRPLVDGITTFSDYHTEVAAMAAERLGLPSPGVGAVRAANDKPLLRRVLGDQPGNVPHLLVSHPRQLARAVRQLGFPMVAKPPAEAISYGVVRVDDVAGLQRAYAELSRIRSSLRGQPRPGHVLLERYVDGPEYSVESVTVDGRTHFYGVTAKHLGPPPTFLEAAHSFPAALDRATRDTIQDTVATVLSRIGYRQGPAHTEVRLSADGLRVIEVNPRMPAGNLTTMVRSVCRRDPQLDAMLLAVGERPVPPDGTQLHGAAVVMLYPPSDGAVLAGIDGLDAAGEVPGVQVVLFARPGDELWHRVDNSARVGLLYAEGADADSALARARQAAGLVTVRVVPSGRQPAWTGGPGGSHATVR